MFAFVAALIGKCDKMAQVGLVPAWEGRITDGGMRQGWFWKCIPVT